MSETESRLEQLFNKASEIESPEERRAFLVEECAGDEALRTQVEELLDAHERAGHFLNGGPEADLHELSGVEEEAGPEGRIGNYRLIKLIGEGAFSRVYLAEQEAPMRRWVALKIIKAGMDTHEVIQRFTRERQVLALMDHPSIAKVFDAGATPRDHPYFAMEWVRGLEITHYCNTNRLPVRQRLELYCQVCRAVMHAHQRGIVHRDLKPSNILVTQSDGQPCPKVIDFGIVKVTRDVASGREGATWGASPMGTPTYMSPEQAQPGNPDVDTRSDIYSLGCLLYELLTGRPPFDHRSLVGASWDNMANLIRAQDSLRPSVRLRRLPADELAEIAAERKSTPNALRRILEDDLDWIVLKALEKERERRYQSAAELVGDIRHHLAHQPVSAAAPSLGYRVRKLLRRNRKAVTVAGVIASLLIASVVVSSRLAFLARSEARQASQSRASAERANLDARQRLIEVNVAAGFAANQRSDYDHALLWFANAARAAGSDSAARATNLLRTRSWLLWNALPIAAFEVPSGLSELQFDPGGLRLLALSRREECVLWDVLGGEPLRWAQEAGPIRAVAWSPDGLLVALATAKGTTEVRQISDGTIVERFPSPVPATALAFSPDGHYLAHGSRRIVLWDLEERSPATVWTHPQDVTEIVFSPLSDWAATACADDLARVFSLSPGPGQFQPAEEPLPHLSSIRTDACANKTAYHENFISTAQRSCMSFLDRGRTLATRSGSYDVTLWKMSSRRELRRFGGICCSCNFRISPDGRTMACGMQGNVVGLWETKSGRPWGAMLPQGGCVFDVAFHPGGTMVLAAGADHEATFWSLQTGKRIGPRLHHFKDVMAVAFSPTGKIVATAQADGLVRIWRVPVPRLPDVQLELDPGPKRARLGNRGRLVVVTKEPNWNQDLHRTRVYHVAGGRPAGPAVEFPGGIQDAAVSPDGLLLAVAAKASGTGSGASLQVLNVENGAIVSSHDLPATAMSLAWHPTEPRLGFICRNGAVGLAAVEPAFDLTWLRGEEKPAAPSRFEIRFSPDGRRLISLGAGDGLEVWDPGKRSQNRSEIPAHGGSIWSFALSKSGRFLATTSIMGTVIVWNMETLQPAGPVLNHHGWVYRADFSPDESGLVTACHDSHAHLWDWATGRQSRNPFTHPDQVLDATFTPDGRWMLTACRDGVIRVWDPLQGGLVMPEVKVGDHALNVEVTEDGRHAVIGSLGGSVQILSLAVLMEPAHMNLQDLCRLGEILSHGEIRKGKRREFTTAEWLSQFQEFRRNHPCDFACLLAENEHEETPDPGDAENTACCSSTTCSSCTHFSGTSDLPTTGPEP